MRKPLHHAITDRLAMEATASIKCMSHIAKERINRQIGQHLRHSLARIELAKREHGVNG